jgi:hypothetical protein
MRHCDVAKLPVGGYVIPFEGMHEGLGDAVGLRAANGREAEFEPELPGKGPPTIPGFSGANGPSTTHGITCRCW